MLLTAERSTPLVIPSVDQRPASEERFALETGEAVARAVSRALSSLLAQGISCAAQDAARQGDADQTPEDQSWTLQWGAPGPQWELLLPVSAAEGLLAGLLGCVQLRPDHPLTATDCALLRLVVAELARETSRELHLPPADSCAVLPPRTYGSPLSPSLRHFALSLEVAGRSHSVHARVAWDDLLTQRQGAPSVGALDARVLSEAKVTVEALLPGPELTARELLELQPGDVICLGLAEQEALLTAEGVPVGRGRAGARAGRLAVNISELSNTGE